MLMYGVLSRATTETNRIWCSLGAHESAGNTLHSNPSSSHRTHLAASVLPLAQVCSQSRVPTRTTPAATVQATTTPVQCRSKLVQARAVEALPLWLEFHGPCRACISLGY